MPDAFSRVLGTGLIPSRRAALYRCPDRVRASVRAITLVNVLAIDAVMNLWINIRGQPRSIVPKDLILKPNRSTELDLQYSLEPGNSIEGEALNPTAVEYTISGIEYR